MNRSLVTLLLLLATLAANAQSAPKKPVRRAPPPPPPPLVLEPAAGEQLAAAAMTYFGDYACEFNQRLQVSLNPSSDGYVDVRFGQQSHTMKPVLSSTGALRLEDVRGRLLLLQIALKSMLLDVQAGRRLVDECVHEQQAENRRTLALAPPLPGLGIEPGRAAEPAALAAPPAASAAGTAAAPMAASSPDAADSAGAAAAPAAAGTLDAASAPVRTSP
jgi:hypothetical protein